MSQFDKIGLTAIGAIYLVVGTGARLVAAKMAPGWLVRLITPPARH